MEVSQ
jgi:hypothetical protein